MIIIACTYGRLDFLKLLYSRYAAPFIVDKMAGNMAAANGHTHILQWLSDIGKLNYSNCAVDYAAYNGHLHTLRWFNASGHQFKYVQAINNAITQGHLHILKWFRTSRYKFRYVCNRIRWSAVDPAVKNWMIEHGIPLRTGVRHHRGYIS